MPPAEDLEERESGMNTFHESGKRENNINVGEYTLRSTG